MSTATSPSKFSTAIAVTAVIFGVIFFLGSSLAGSGVAVAQSMPDG